MQKSASLAGSLPSKEPVVFCPKCGAENEDNAFRCVKCVEVIQDVPVRYVQTDPADDPMRILLPVGRTILSVAAGYLGLISVLLVPAPLALVISILAIRELKQKPKMLGKGRAVFGLIMGSLGTIGLILVTVAMLTAPGRTP